MAMAHSTRRRGVRDFLKSRPSRVWQVLAAIVALVLFGWMWWKLPPALYRNVTGDARVKAITDTRTALLAGLVGLGAIGTFWLNSRVYKITARTFQLTEQGQITERYTKAIEQLGAERLDVRLGGIYALERIAIDSDRDHPTIVEVLSAFVREHSKRDEEVHRPPPPNSSLGLWVPLAVNASTINHPQPTEDVQAALTVLGRLPTRKGVVARAHLAGANLAGAWLGGVNLSGAHLGGVNLSGAHLGGANLSGAHLRAADLTRADLYWADLAGAELTGAGLSGADLGMTNLTGAHLSMADLSGAHLDGADLSAAHSSGRTLEKLEI